MPTEWGHTCASITLGSGSDEEKPKKMTRARYLALTKLAKETVESLEKKGVTREEACLFGQMCEKMFDLGK